MIPEGPESNISNLEGNNVEKYSNMDCYGLQNSMFRQKPHQKKPRNAQKFNVIPEIYSNISLKNRYKF
jgi:hypothetical protein